MLLSFYTISFILLILIVSTTQLIVLSYLIKVRNRNLYNEYKGHEFTKIKDMVNFMLKEKFPEGVENICIYNAGYRQGRRIVKNYNENCKSVLRYVYPHYSDIEYNVMYPHSYRQNVYYCGGNVTYNFQTILDYALKNHCYIKFIPRGIKPTPPPLRICIHTLSGRKCQIKDPSISGYWRKIWSDCNIECFFSAEYTIARKKVSLFL